MYLFRSSFFLNKNLVWCDTKYLKKTIMSTRTAAIIIDNFLPDDKWNYIQDNISDYLNASEFVENRNNPYAECIGWIKEKLKTFEFYNEHWNVNLDEWSFINACHPTSIENHRGLGITLTSVDLYTIFTLHGMPHGVLIFYFKIVM